jgi:hypothetical protein
VPSAPYVIPPLLLIALLVFSAVAKLRARGDTTSVFEQLKLPRALIRLKGPALLPYGELAVAALLLFLPGGWYVVAATLTLLLFLAYVVVVARALTFPYPLMCGCFGELGLGWITRQTLVRNVILLAIAVVTWADAWRGEGVFERLRDLGDGWWWLAGVVVAMVTTALVVHEGRLPVSTRSSLPSDDYLAVPIPYGVLDGPDGPGSVWQLSDTAARLLVFVEPTSEDADELIAHLPAWQELLAPARVHLVARGEWSGLSAARPELGEALLGDPDGRTSLVLRVHEQPGAVLLGTDRYFAGGPAFGLDEIDELVQAAAEQIRESLESLDSPDPADDHAGHGHPSHDQVSEQQADAPAQ